MRVVPYLASVVAALALAQSGVAQKDATEVIERHVDKLDRALAIALATQPKAMSAAIIVDVTPYTFREAPKIAAALRALGTKDQKIKSWRIARLGQTLGDSVREPGELVGQLDRVFQRETRTDNTFESLRRTLRNNTSGKAAIVYLADWHVEDDFRLEQLCAKLRAKGQTFTTIGTEACFGRAWNDGFFPPHRTTGDLYDHGIGRNPFVNDDKHAPWHGGDTAWQHVPFYLHGASWSTKFPAKMTPPPREKPGRYAKPKLGAGGDDEGGSPEDLRERLKEIDEKALEVYHFPLPSGFGPYGLMRLAAETGGKYVLWSWNPGGRSDLRYDYANVDRYAPDLRARKTILKDIRRQRLAKAILEAWNTAADEEVVTSRQTPAVDERYAPRTVEEVNGPGYVSYGWDDKTQWKEFLAQAPKTMKALDKAIKVLERAIQSAGIAKDPVTRRYLADAELLYQTLLVHRFTVGEAYVEAKKVPEKTAWDKYPLHPTVTNKYFIEPNSNSKPHEVRVREVKLHDPKLGAKVLAERRKFLAKYAMTPHGELVARNGVTTMRIYFNTYATGDPTKDSPAESGEKKPRPGTPGSSGRAGPTTGGGKK